MTENTKYKILTAIRYLGDGFFYPFFSLYLVSANLAEARVGFILSLTPIISILVNPLYAKFCTNMKRTRDVLKIITILEAFAIITIGLTSNFYLITVLAVLLALFGSCHYGLMDSLTSVYASENNISYTSIRVFGSIAYIVATTVGGYAIKYLGYPASFAISGALFIVSGIIYSFIKPVIITKETEQGKPSYKAVLKNKDLLIFIAFYLLLVGTSFAVDHFLSLYLESRGLSESDYGLVYSYFVLIEVIMLFILNRFFKKANPEKLLLIATIAFLIRMMVNYLYLPIWAVVLLCGLRGVTYAIILHVTFPYIVRITGERNATVAIMFMTMLYSLYLGIGDNINGNLLGSYSYKHLYLLAIIIGAIALMLALFRYVYYRKKNKKNNTDSPPC